MKERALEVLKERITKDLGTTDFSVFNLGSILCGSMNADLAKDPFSAEFLQNVTYNSLNSMSAILYLQLMKA